MTLPVYFWGDLDWSGMRILTAMRNKFPEMQAWQPGYSPMLESLLMGLGRQKFAVDPSWAQRIEESRALWKEQKVVDSLNKARQMLHGTIEMIQKSTKQSQLFN